jgi:hypothetical protein
VLDFKNRDGLFGFSNRGWLFGFSNRGWLFGFRSRDWLFGLRSRDWLLGFNYKDIMGWLLGFRGRNWWFSFNSWGWHLGFNSRDRLLGFRGWLFTRVRFLLVNCFGRRIMFLRAGLLMDFVNFLNNLRTERFEHLVIRHLLVGFLLLSGSWLFGCHRLGFWDLGVNFWNYWCRPFRSLRKLGVASNILLYHIQDTRLTRLIMRTITRSIPRFFTVLITWLLWNIYSPRYSI